MFRRKVQCGCGCGRKLTGKEAKASSVAGKLAHIIDGLDVVVGESVPARDDPGAIDTRRRLAQVTMDGEAIVSELLEVAHGERELPPHRFEEIDAWMDAAIEFSDSQTKA